MGDRTGRAVTRGTSWRWPSRLVPILIIVGSNLMVMSASGALPQLPLLNDLLALGQLGGQTPAKAPLQKNPEPPQTATPQVNRCAPGAREEPGVQGRVPAGSASKGLWCNAELVSHQGRSGGFKVLEYVDDRGRRCAYYDTALLFPINAFKLDSSSLGVAVLDMSDPSHPRQTATLTQPPMMSPHESLSLNSKRGLLAAVMGNPTTYPGLVSIYDVSSNCSEPVLQSTRPVARLGHESGFSPDGRTFYATGTAYQAITAVDVTDPRNPHAIWHGNVTSHGMSLSNDGNRAYIADPGGQMAILDTSEIQARKPNPQVREVSRLTWDRASIPQNAIPFTRDGKPYVLEFDEYTAGTTGGGDPDAVGAARIIDISDEAHPRVVSNLRLQVNNPAEHAAASNDPGAMSPVQGYAAHYCNIPSRVDPKVVACSFIVSGLRVFDISKLREPKEIAYYVAPTKPVAENGFQASNFAMSQPAFGPQRQIWFTDGASGFYNVQVAKTVWPGAVEQNRR
ncbi:MAG: LVIVD repeat-containing protein [Solirubrobacterales bacterium]